MYHWSLADKIIMYHVLTGIVWLLDSSFLKMPKGYTEREFLV